MGLAAPVYLSGLKISGEFGKRSHGLRQKRLLPVLLADLERLLQLAQRPRLKAE